MFLSIVRGRVFVWADVLLWQHRRCVDQFGSGDVFFMHV